MGNYMATLESGREASEDGRAPYNDDTTVSCGTTGINEKEVDNDWLETASAMAEETAVSIAVAFCLVLSFVFVLDSQWRKQADVNTVVLTTRSVDWTFRFLLPVCDPSPHECRRPTQRTYYDG